MSIYPIGDVHFCFPCRHRHSELKQDIAYAASTHKHTFSSAVMTCEDVYFTVFIKRNIVSDDVCRSCEIGEIRVIQVGYFVAVIRYFWNTDRQPRRFHSQNKIRACFQEFYFVINKVKKIVFPLRFFNYALHFEKRPTKHLVQAMINLPGQRIQQT